MARASRLWDSLSQPRVVPWCIAAVLVVLGVHAADIRHGTSDTFTLLHGVGAVDRCLRAQIWDCGSSGLGYIGPAAVIQYIPALAAKRLGATIEQGFRVLELVNYAAFAGTVLLLWRTGRRAGDAALGALLAAVGLCGPLLWYSDSTFGEGLGVLFVTAFACAAVLRKGGVVLALTLWAAAIYKEPALPFLLVLGLIALLRAPGASRITRPQVAGLACGALAAVATNTGFNAFRGGGPGGAASPLSSGLTAVHVPLPDIGQRLESAAGLLAAPNAGLLWFWPLALGCLALGIVAARRTHPSLRQFLTSPSAGAVLVFALLLGGVASFYTPYGFSAWGPRYLVPWMPAFALVALHRVWPAAREIVARSFAGTRIAVAAGAVILALALPQLSAFLSPNLAYAHFHPDARCPIGLSDIQVWADRFGSISSYYDCTRHLAWGKGRVLVEGYAALARPARVPFVLVYVVAVLSLLRVAASSDRSRAASSGAIV